MTMTMAPPARSLPAACISPCQANPAKMQSIAASLASLLSHDPHLKHLAQRSLVTYLRSIYLQVRKSAFSTLLKRAGEDMCLSKAS